MTDREFIRRIEARLEVANRLFRTWKRELVAEQQRVDKWFEPRPKDTDNA